MSVGGKVVETITLDDKVWIDTETGTGVRCAIYVERTPAARSVGEGDTVWWQGRDAYWTPSNGAFSEKILRRIGFSGVDRPPPPEHREED